MKKDTFCCLKWNRQFLFVDLAELEHDDEDEEAEEEDAEEGGGEDQDEEVQVHGQAEGDAPLLMGDQGPLTSLLNLYSSSIWIIPSVINQRISYRFMK
jgi:hypothetical protein